MSRDCVHYRGGCTIGVHRDPSPGTCKHCAKREPRPQPLTIAGERPRPLGRVPHAEWPRWASWLAERREGPDAGVGDTFARLLGVGGIAFKAATRALGIPCNCARRQSEWNRRYPYTP